MIYLDRGWISAVWRTIKRVCCRSFLGSTVVLAIFVPYFVVRSGMEDLRRLRNPVRPYTDYRAKRGMSAVHDWIDWLGGYPYEFAKPREVVRFLEARGFALHRLKDSEYVFRRIAD